MPESRPAAPGDFVGAVSRALERPAGGPLASAIPAAAQTVIVVDAGDARSRAALPVVIAALVRSGHPRGRLVVVAAAAATPARTEASARAAWTEAAGGVPVVFHDADRSAVFRAGRTAEGIDVEVDDELREAEAVVALGAIRESGAGMRRPAEWLIVPGLASRATCETLRAATSPSRGSRALDAHDAWSAAAALVHVDFEIAWRGGEGREVVRSGVPPFVFEDEPAHARARRDP
jgi:nickel-dependent lactate racemase